MPTSRASVSIGTTRPQLSFRCTYRRLLPLGEIVDPAGCVGDPERPLLKPKQRQEQQRIGVAEVKAQHVRAACEQRGWQVVQVYSDNGVSGSKGRSLRPGLDALLKDASRGRFNVVVVWALDRLGRSLIDLLDTLNELDAAAAALVLHEQAIDTTTPAWRMFFQVTGAFAEFERGMIRSRVMAGLERARARGVRLGRPRTGAKVEAAVRARLAAGDGIKKVAKAIGVGNGTVSRIKAAMAA
jgi:DNA invertase Pin-like site-specific DNA recombinase